ncbi:MAG TPA: taurine dioxygenase [Gammaproteobacteria bacterium]|uniref:TauD/TfdA dioxygenase family protein n=1 Tax=Immundisolibacter sp. TaxID=1934948 RepID=UPI000E9D0E89|nr:taurine dioxygenase [Gammaproteobacteria bacterium]HCZ48446.1 taurine dioxygenase [Gammaproteobacteria bacterium]MCH77884.1 taurine dioxygenase [Gammaproteobacteria bacterium]
MAYHHICVKPFAGALGAEVSGVDLAALPEAALNDIRVAWLRHLVLLFRDQSLTSSQYLAFARRIGEPVEYPLLRGLPDYPLIVPVIKQPHECVNFGGLWHSDTAYLDAPPVGATLLAREVPPVGGDTLFANMYLAYEALSHGMRGLLDGLRAVNTSVKADVTRTREDRLSDAGARRRPDAAFEAVHPVVRTHPQTGRKLLYVNYGHTVRFEGMTEDESAPLLQYLFTHLARPEFTCRVRWQVGTLALWDNRCTQHNPINDYSGHRRVMHRISLGAERPR